MLHSAGQILCWQQCLGQRSTSTQPEHRFIGGCTSPWATLSSLSGYRLLPLSGFYGRISPTSLTWCFLDKGHVLGTSHLISASSTPGPSTLPILPAWPSWHQQPGNFGKTNLCWPPASPGQRVSSLWVRLFFEVVLELLNNARDSGFLTK